MATEDEIEKAYDKALLEAFIAYGVVRQVGADQFIIRANEADPRDREIVELCFQEAYEKTGARFRRDWKRWF